MPSDQEQQLLSVFYNILFRGPIRLFRSGSCTRKQNKTKQKIVIVDSTNAASLRLLSNAVIIFLPKSLCFKMQTGESKLCPSVFFDFAIQRQRTQ